MHHGFKHFPARGVTPDHTRHGPARYLAGYGEAAVQALETETTARPDRFAGTPAGGLTQYLRDAGHVIGWDEGLEASLSYVECSGGETTGRSFHGRPLHAASRTLASFANGETS